MGIIIENVSKLFPGQKREALAKVNAHFPLGKITGIVGPDGAGKTTLIRLLAGLIKPTEGRALVHGIDCALEQQKLYETIAYMPQRFGLYENLTVMQNLHLYIKLQGVDEASSQIDTLLHFAGLLPFKDRLAGKLSGGMKQKLGLICTLLKKPLVLLLDEPSVGVDPLSRRELWKMIEEFKKHRATIVWSTSYLDEAERCDHVLLLNEGEKLFEGPPNQLIVPLKGKAIQIKGISTQRRDVLDNALASPCVADAIIQGDSVRMVLWEAECAPKMEELKTGPKATLSETQPSLEDAFILLLKKGEKNTTEHQPQLMISKKKHITGNNTVIIEVKNLTKRFGSFTAVDNLSFDVKRGEIFGLIGPNGAGKSTTFKILCGLLKPSEGKALISHLSMLKAPGQARSSFGYMAQKFSLYDNMSLLQNMRFFSGVYPVPPEKRNAIIENMVELFHLKPYLHQEAGSVPLGIKQRLALACSLMHEPDILFLDEPTSGVDPLTRREFWHHINLLAEQGVTILVTTHYMAEAEYCDRIGFIHRGVLRALGSPTELKESVASATIKNPTLEETFIQLCSDL